MDKKAVIFDLDGTLIDSTDGVIKIVDEITLELFGKKPGYDLVKKYLGWLLSQIFEYVIKDLLKLSGKNLSQTELEKIISKSVDLYHEKVASDKFAPRIFDGVIDMLDDLFTKNIELFLLTANTDVYLDAILNKFKFGKFFKNTYAIKVTSGKCKDSSSLLKCKVDMVNDIIESNKFDRKNVIMVGDGVKDVIAGKENGIQTIVVLYGNESDECELRKYSAQNAIFVNNATEILKNIKKIFDV